MRLRRPRPQHRAVGQHHLQRQHLLPHAAVLAAQEPQPVRRDRPADRRDAHRPRVVPEHQPVRRQLVVHVREHRAGFGPHPTRNSIDLPHALHRPQIEHDPRRQRPRPAHQPRPAPMRHDRHPALARHPHRRRHLLRRRCPHDGHRHHRGRPRIVKPPRPAKRVEHRVLALVIARDHDILRQHRPQRRYDIISFHLRPSASSAENPSHPSRVHRRSYGRLNRHRIPSVKSVKSVVPRPPTPAAPRPC